MLFSKIKLLQNSEPKNMLVLSILNSTVPSNSDKNQIWWALTIIQILLTNWLKAFKYLNNTNIPPRRASRFRIPASFAFCRLALSCSTDWSAQVMCSIVSRPQKFSIVEAMHIELVGFSQLLGSPAGCHVMSQNRGFPVPILSNLQSNQKPWVTSQICNDTVSSVKLQINQNCHSLICSNWNTTTEALSVIQTGTR